MINYEVEQKFPVADLSVLESRLAALGVAAGPAVEETDLYFSHPAVNFVETDEALRVRRKGQKALITYKGPKIDAATKTRREIELPLGDREQAAAWAGLLEALRFRPVFEVVKSRRKAMIPWQGRQIEASLDTVQGLGTFVELELVVGPEELETAKAAVASLAQSLGLTDHERRSYLRLLLEKNATAAPPDAPSHGTCHVNAANPLG